LYVPGELEAQFEAHRMRDGIPLNDSTLADLADAARRFGVVISGAGRKTAIIQVPHSKHRSCSATISYRV
jgi:hypothetical protein